MNVNITFKNGHFEKWTVSEHAAKQAGNVNNAVFKDFVESEISMIEVKRMNAQGEIYTERTYDAQLEQWRKDHARIEAVNKPGYEDYSGYGSRTEGRKNRFYIGRSTGWIPIYLAINNTRSSGGPAIMFFCIESMKRIY